jgi:phosphatidylglycerophosphate synthase
MASMRGVARLKSLCKFYMTRGVDEAAPPCGKRVMTTTSKIMTLLPERGVVGARRQGTVLICLLAPLVFIGAFALDSAHGLVPAGVATALFGAAGLRALHAMRHYGIVQAGFGAANTVTLIRLALLCVLSVALIRGEVLATSSLVVFALAVFALSLDGLDGWLARRHGTATAFGARFDMEVDAAFACLLSLVLLVSGRAGPEILLLGVIRYVFVAAGMIWPWLKGPLPERFGRKLVCVVQIATLCLLLLPGVPPLAAQGLVIGAAGLLLWSFGRDTLYLARHR